jgi:hypothetical protein
MRERCNFLRLRIAAVVAILHLLGCQSLSQNTKVTTERYFAEEGVAVRILSVVVDISKNGNFGERLWGGGNENRTTIVEDIFVSKHGKPLFLPLSSVSGLANVSEIRVWETKDDLTITLRGGDASASYLATLTFANARVMRRTVQSREFPDDAKEITHYQYNDLEN